MRAGSPLQTWRSCSQNSAETTGSAWKSWLFRQQGQPGVYYWKMGERDMSEFFSSNSMIMLERAANFNWVKQRAVLDNIANAETPNYKVKYVTFEEALRSSVRMANLAAAPRGAVRTALTGSVPVVHTAADESARMDENGVDVSEQSMELVRNAFQVQHVYRAISGDMSRLLMAIRGQ